MFCWGNSYFLRVRWRNNYNLCAISRKLIFIGWTPRMNDSHYLVYIYRSLFCNIEQIVSDALPLNPNSIKQRCLRNMGDPRRMFTFLYDHMFPGRITWCGTLKWALGYQAQELNYSLNTLIKYVFSGCRTSLRHIETGITRNVVIFLYPFQSFVETSCLLKLLIIMSKTNLNARYIFA